MIRLLWLLLCTALALNASTILNYNVYERTDRADVMITFDTPNDGAIRQVRQSDKIIIKLDDTTIDAPKVKTVASAYLSKLTITPLENHVQIIAKTPSDTILQASKTSDGYGLRLRFLKEETGVQSSKTAASGLNALPTKQEGDLSYSYYAVITILIIGILVLLWLKRSIAASQNSTQKIPSIFGKKSITEGEDVTIRFQKPLDAHNSVVMLDFADESYLVLTGNSNVLLEKFNKDAVVSKNQFDDMLQSKHQDLDTFLRIQNENEALRSYKEKASGPDYDDHR